LAQEPGNQHGGHLSASLKGSEVLRSFLKSFRWPRKCFLQTEVNIARMNVSVVLRCSCRQSY